MTSQSTMTDLAALTRNRARARKNPAMFLQTAVADDLQLRLNEINRPFTNVAIVTAWPEIWQDRFPNAILLPDDPVLGFTSTDYDLVIHAMGLNWANDPVGQMIQCQRVLRPDGLFLGAGLGGQTLHELRRVLAQAEIQVTGGLSPRVAPMAEIRDLGVLVQRAGLALPVADSDTYTVTYADMRALMHDLRAMGETNALAARLRHASRRAVFEVAQDLYATHFAMPDGRIPATFEVVVLTGWAPAPDQQKPLRPGSATSRLADALGATETPLDPGQN